MKQFSRILKGAGVMALGLLCIFGANTAVKANSKETAVEIPINGSASGYINGKDDAAKQMWFKFTVPVDIGNQYVSMTMEGDSSLGWYDDWWIETPGGKGGIASGSDISSITYTLFRIEGSKCSAGGMKYLTPGETYYIYTKSEGKGTIKVSLGTTPEDNWGSLDKAESLDLNSSLDRKLEDEADIDSFVFSLPNDGKKYYFRLKSPDLLVLELYNEVGIKENESAGDEKTMEIIGDGKKHYATVQSEWTVDRSTTYTVTLAADSQTPTVATVTTSQKSPTVKKAKSVSIKSKRGGVLLRWKRNAKMSGYKIYRSTKKKGKYKCIKTLKSNKKTSYTDKRVKSKKTYYYKVKFYKKAGKKIVRSKTTAALRVRVR